VLADARFDLRYKFRRVAFQHLLNSRRKLAPQIHPASFPTVEPKSLNGSDTDRLQYGRDAVSAATEVSARRKYETFSLPFPVPSRVIKNRAAACVARPVKPLLFEL